MYSNIDVTLDGPGGAAVVGAVVVVVAGVAVVAGGI